MVNIAHFFDINGPKWADSPHPRPVSPLIFCYFPLVAGSFPDSLLTANNLPQCCYYIVLLRTL